MTLKTISLIALSTLFSFVSYAQEADESHGPRITQMFGETRFGFKSENNEWYTNNKNTGFRGDYLNFRIDGQIIKGLTFSYRQRFNKNTSSNFFDSTDWLHIDWKATSRLSIGAGKQVVAIGGFEYDRAPIDLYYCSEFWQNIACYQMGISATYNVTSKDQLLLQICNSPFHSWDGCSNTYAANLMWYGNHGFWETMWSVNAMQYTRSDMIYYIALGNRFNITRGLHLDIDAMNRTAKNQNFLDDWSVMAELSYQPIKSLRCHVKYTHDENKSGTQADYLVQDGTNINMVSGGVEFSPLKNHLDALRIFAVAGYASGTNSNSSGVLLYDSEREMMMANQFLLEVGAKIKIAK